MSARAPGPPGLFGLRNMVRFFADPLRMLEEVSREHGAFVTMRIGGQRWHLVSDPDDVEFLLVKSARSLGRDTFTPVLARVLGQGLLTSDGELWKRQRKLMAQAFTPRRISGYGDAIARIGAERAAALRDHEVIDVHAEMSRLTLEVVADVLFGASVAPEDVAMVREALDVISEFLEKSPEALLGLPDGFPSPRMRRLRRSVAALDALIFAILEERRKAPPRDDLLGTLLAAQDEDGARMSDRQLRDEALTLFLAGHETTALALAHTLFAIAQHPEVDARLFAEVRDVLGDRVPTAADAARLVYTEQVVREGLRLYPPAWNFGRGVIAPIELRGMVLAPGDQLMFSPWVMHRRANYYPEPERFDPERFSKERAASIPRYAYLPFGAGPRVCIGNHFAMLEATLLLAQLIQRARFELLPDQTLRFAPSVTLRPAGAGIRMRVTPRDAGALAPSE